MGVSKLSLSISALSLFDQVGHISSNVKEVVLVLLSRVERRNIIRGIRSALIYVYPVQVKVFSLNVTPDLFRTVNTIGMTRTKGESKPGEYIVLGSKGDSQFI